MSKLPLFFCSFLILFLELSLIRWIPANMRLVGYFSNLILLGTFLGMGLGFLLAKKKVNLAYFFPLGLAILLGLVAYFKVEISISSPDEIFFRGLKDESTRLEPEILLPIIFSLTALTFVTISQQLGRLFVKFKPLTAYSTDILGALAGIGLFAIFSHFSVMPFWWFLTVSLIFVLINLGQINLKFYLGLIPLVLVVLIPLLSNGDDVTWSPYYKITVTKTFNNFYNVEANHISHQYISPYLAREPFYFTPYQAFRKTNYQDILIIGAGTGADIATALGLGQNVKSIDAVEIDPKIYQIGKQLNPDHPFTDSRVHVHIDDGRSFLQHTDKKYDLIIYALTDSLVLTGNSSNIRLESFLFTEESFKLAKQHLSANGVFSLYNYYRETWLIDKIATMLNHAFGYPPYVLSYGSASRAAIFLTGPKIAELTPSITLKPNQGDPSLATSSDNWPFLYLKSRTIPFFYLKALIIILAISAISIFLVTGRTFRRLDFRFFFFGAGFLLLETKSLASFALLFGSTWLVNSLVISAILIFVLIANLISSKFTLKSLWPYYLALFVILFLNLLIPPSTFSNLSLISRYILSSIFYFSPIMLANLIFSQLFKKASASDISFGSNLLGAVLGGLIEYSSLILGYQLLIVIIALFYLLSLLKLGKSNPIRLRL